MRGGGHGDRVGAHRHPPDGLDPGIENLEHGFGHEHGAATRKGGLAGVHVPVGNGPRRQAERPVGAEGVGAEMVDQRLTRGHGPRMVEAGQEPIGGRSIVVAMDVVRIANCSGFFGDRLAAAKEMVDGGPIDFLTGDYLAELTMALLWRARRRDSTRGYAHTFLRQMEDVMGVCVERGIRVVSNAGGLAPTRLADELNELAYRLGLSVTVATVTGDDLTDRLGEVEIRSFPNGGRVETDLILTANAYLGCAGIAAALDAGADIVVCGRVTDAALVMGPAVHAFGWPPDDWDRLASALVAGHILECGAQATGGNFSFFREVPGLEHVGFPLVEMRSDGSFVVTKHPGTGGMVTTETVTAQLLYEIGGHRYANPDVTARFDTIRLREAGPDRVEVSGVLGEPPPPDLKVAVTRLGGYRNQVTFVLTGLDIPEKAEAVEHTLWQAVGGPDRFADHDVKLIRSDHPDPASNEEAMAYLRFTVYDPDRDEVGRAFSNAAVEMALAHYPGMFLTSPPGDATPFTIFEPGLVARGAVPMTVTIRGESFTVSSDGPAVQDVRGDEPAPTPEPPSDDATVTAPLGEVVGARSGDKGSDANVGVWVRDPAAFPWLVATLTVDLFRRLVPDAADLEVERHVFPNLYALNFEIRGLLGGGAAANPRVDPQAKSLGEYLRARLVEIPAALIPR